MDEGNQNAREAIQRTNCFGDTGGGNLHATPGWSTKCQNSQKYVRSIMTRVPNRQTILLDLNLDLEHGCLFYL